MLPSLIVAGLMAIPYIDFNKAGNGYYTIKERMFSYSVFQFGFLEMWITLIVLGTLLRGPNWNFFGPYEHWDAHKVQALNNVNLSEFFWEKLCGKSLPGDTRFGRYFGFARSVELASVDRLVGWDRRPVFTVFLVAFRARIARDSARPRLLYRLAASDGAYGFSQVLQANGFRSLYGHGQSAAVHGIVTDQDVAAMDF